MFVVLMIGRKGFADLVMIQQMRTGTRILGQNQVHLFQDLECPEGNVFEVADWRGDEVEQGGMV